MKRSPSFGKRILFRVVLLVVLIVLAEVGSFAVFWRIDGRAFSYARVFEERRELAAAVGPVDATVQSSDEEEASVVEDPLERAAELETARQVLHPYLGYTRKPAKRQRSRGPRWGGRWVGEHGFLTDERYLYEPSPNRCVIGIAGGSVATFFSLYGIETLIERLRAHPAFADKEIAVTRMSLGGYKQPQQLIALNYFLSIGAHFDLVINLDGFNEVALPPHSNVPKGVFPFYPNHWYTRVSTAPDPELRRLVGEREYLHGRRAELSRAFQGSPLRYSTTWNLVWRWLDQRRRAELARNEAAVVAYEPAERSAQTHGPPKSYPSDEAMYADLVEGWRRSSELMHDVCRAQGIEYFHFLQPNQYVPNSKSLTTEEQRIAYVPGSRYETPVRSGYPGLAAAGRELEAAGVRFTDLTMLFESVSESTYEDSCCHLNTRGNELLAQAVADAVLEGH